ncbi:MAG: hypothetical protein AB7F75_04990 [Planctomycetota bacterium]
MNRFTACFLLLCAPVVLSADTVIRMKGGEREELKGTVVDESIKEVSIKIGGDDGKIEKIAGDSVVSVERDSLPKALMDAKESADAAGSAEECKAAASLLDKVIQSSSKEWHKEYAARFKVSMFLANNMLDEAVKALDEMNTLAKQSRYIYDLTNNACRLGVIVGNGAVVKKLVGSLKGQGGTLSAALAAYYEGEMSRTSNPTEAESKYRLAFNQMKNNDSPQGRELWLDASCRYGQQMVIAKKLDAAREQAKLIEERLPKLDDRGKGAYYCLMGDILRSEAKDPDALYAYMRVVVQHPTDRDLQAHSMDWALFLSEKLQYKDTAVMLTAEMSRRFPSYRRQAK